MNWYTGNTTYDTVVTIGLVIAALVIIGGLFRQSPYGRFGVNGQLKLPVGGHENCP